jgi:3-deoxy-D-manno-octulosonic-acid transferase
VILAYEALLLALVALASPLALLAWLAGAFGPRGAVLERLRPLPRMPEGTVWVHAASVGEAEAAAPLIHALVDRGMPVIATALTLNGRARLRARLPHVPSRLMPLDLPGLVHVSLARANVGVVVLIETELWPVLISAAHARGARVIVAGARLSDRSFPGYLRLRAFFAPLLARLHAIGAKSALDRERFVALGAAPERASVIGDLKLDRPAPPDPSPSLISALGPGPFVLGGSTHPGEEEALIAGWRRLRSEGAKDLRLLLVPRHPERAPEVLRTARRFGVSVALRSFGALGADVVVVDSVGELASLYHLAEIVFVGGTLAHVGGHNFVEPVQAGRIAVHGPHVENQRAQVELLAPLGVLVPIANAAELERALVTLWADPERNAPALAAAKQLDANRGATVRTLERVLEARAARV